MVSRTIEPVPTAQQYKDRSSTAEQGASTSPVGGSNPSGPARAFLEVLSRENLQAGGKPVHWDARITENTPGYELGNMGSIPVRPSRAWIV